VAEELEAIGREVHGCRSCPLWKTRNRAVPGEGPGYAKCMLIGESPGADEDRVGRPFVGRSGRYLNGVLEEHGLNRESLFITGSVKCHPPGNRDPRRLELESCRPYLDRQIRAISPRVIVLLGRIATRGFLGDMGMAEARERIWIRGGTKFLPTYHPAAAMRFPSRGEHFRDDVRKLAGILRRTND